MDQILDDVRRLIVRPEIIKAGQFIKSTFFHQNKMNILYLYTFIIKP